MFYPQPPRKEHFPLLFHLAYKRGQTRRYSREDGQREGVGLAFYLPCYAGQTTPALPSFPCSFLGIAGPPDPVAKQGPTAIKRCPQEAGRVAPQLRVLVTLVKDLALC